MKKALGLLGLVTALMLLPGLAAAQVQITVHMTDGTADNDLTDGTGHFVGEEALQGAVWTLQHNFDAAGMMPTAGEADDATITILDSGHYIGGILVGVRNLTMTVAAGQAPTIEGKTWAQTIIVGHDYAGTPFPSSFSLIGDSNENRITLLGSQVLPHYGAHCVNDQSEGLVLENIDYFPGQEPGGCPENHHGHPFVGPSAGATGTYSFTNMTINMLSNSAGAGSNMQNGPWMTGNVDYVYNNVDFVSGGFWTHGIFHADATASFTDCSIIGQGCNMNSGTVNHLRTTFLTNAHPIRDDVWAGSANIHMTFDDCTFTSGSDVMVGMVNGGSATVKNSTINSASATVLAARVRGGSVTFENCVIDGPGFDNAGGDISIPANLTIDRCMVRNGSEIRFFAAGAGSTAQSFVNVNNTIWNGTAGTAINSQPLMDGGTVVQQTTLTATHSTFLGAYADIPISYGAGLVNMSYCIVDGTNSVSQATLWGNTDIVGQGNLLWDGNAMDDGYLGDGSVPGDTIVANPVLNSTGHIANGGSSALEAAIGSTETIDVDGQARPQPASTVNDIGADESGAAPVFTIFAASPLVQSPPRGTSATFMISVAHENGSLSYEWFFDNGSGAVAIPGSNTPGITVDAIEDGDGGTYYCVVTDDDGPVTGPVFTLVVPPPMPLTVWPVVLLLGAASLITVRRRQVVRCR